MGVRTTPCAYQLLDYQGWNICMLLSLTEFKQLLPTIPLDGPELTIVADNSDLVVARPPNLESVEWDKV